MTQAGYTEDIIWRSVVRERLETGDSVDVKVYDDKERQFTPFTGVVTAIDEKVSVRDKAGEIWPLEYHSIVGL